MTTNNVLFYLSSLGLLALNSMFSSALSFVQDSISSASNILQVAPIHYSSNAFIENGSSRDRSRSCERESNSRNSEDYE